MSGTQEPGAQSRLKTLDDPLPDQVPANSARQKVPTKSLPSNSARRRSRPSPCRAIQRGRVPDQVLVEQFSEAEVSTKSLPSNSARRRFRPSPSRATQRGGGPNPVLLTHVGHDKTCRHQITSGPVARHIEGMPRSLYQHDGTLPHTVSALWDRSTPVVENLSIEVATVTHMSGRTEQYTIPSVHMLGG